MLNEEMLVQLWNKCLPVQTLPSKYDFELYHCTFLHPCGMRLRVTFVDLWMCSKCRRTKKTPVLPKDVIANFQYYGHFCMFESVYIRTT